MIKYFRKYLIFSAWNIESSQINVIKRNDKFVRSIPIIFQVNSIPSHTYGWNIFWVWALISQEIMNQFLNFKENIKVKYMYLCTDIVCRPGTSSGGGWRWLRCAIALFFGYIFTYTWKFVTNIEWSMDQIRWNWSWGYLQHFTFLVHVMKSVPSRVLLEFLCWSHFFVIAHFDGFCKCKFRWSLNYLKL